MIIRPEEGWEENAVYLVDVSFRKSNPIHRSVLFSGLLHNGEPGNYHMICNVSYGENFTLRDVYYLKVVKKIATRKDFDFEPRLPPEEE